MTVAKLLGVSPKTFDDTLRPRLPATAIKGTGGTLRFDAAECVLVLVAYRIEQATPRATAANMSEDDVDLYSKSDSPNLERLRSAKADREEMARDRDRGTHTNLKDLHTTLSRFAGLLRRGGEVLQRRFDKDAAEIFNRAVDDAERDCLDEIRANSVGGAPTQSVPN